MSEAGELHKVRGRLYNDDQLFRIIVPLRFTLRRSSLTTQTRAGFSIWANPIRSSISPRFSSADILLVLQHRWPEKFLDLTMYDIDNVNKSVGGMGNHLESGVDPLDLDSLTLPHYCRENIYSDPARRADVLSAFEMELTAAKKLQGLAVEVSSLSDVAPEIVEHVIVARNSLKMSWHEIASSVDYAYWEPRDHADGSKRLGACEVEELFKLHSESRTRIFRRCVKGRFDQQLLWMIPMAASGSLRTKQIEVPNVLIGTRPVTPITAIPRQMPNVQYDPDRIKKASCPDLSSMAQHDMQTLKGPNQVKDVQDNSDGEERSGQDGSEEGIADDDIIFR